MTIPQGATTSTIYHGDEQLFVNLTARNREQIGTLITVLQRQADARRDYIVEPGDLRLAHDEVSDLVCAEIRHPGVTGIVRYPVRPVGHEDLSDWAGIPWAYYSRLLGSEPDLLIACVNRHLPKLGKNLQVRVLGDTLQSVRGDTYLSLPNLPMFHAVFSATKAMGAEIIRAQLSESRFHLGIVRSDWAENVYSVDAGGGASFTYAQDGRILPLVVTGNSEIGRGGLTVEVGDFVMLCRNENLWQNVYDRVHRGTRLAAGFVSAATRQAEAKVVFSLVTDATTSAFDPERFARMVEARRQADQTAAVTSPTETGAILQEQFKLSDAELDLLLNEFGAPKAPNSSATTVGGIAAAVTRIAQDVGTTDPDRELALVRIGPKIIQQGEALLTQANAQRILSRPRAR